MRSDLGPPENLASGLAFGTPDRRGGIITMTPPDDRARDPIDKPAAIL